MEYIINEIEAISIFGIISKESEAANPSLTGRHLDLVPSFISSFCLFVLVLTIAKAFSFEPSVPISI